MDGQPRHLHMALCHYLPCLEARTKAALKKAEVAVQRAALARELVGAARDHLEEARTILCGVDAEGVTLRQLPESLPDEGSAVVAFTPSSPDGIAPEGG